jgi:hypothetical protein
LSHPAHGQFNIGFYGSSFNLPAANFKTFGPGLTIEYENSEKVITALSLQYASKLKDGGQVSYTPPNGNPYDINFQYDYRFLRLSANFYGYLAGSADYTSKVSFFLGGGMAAIKNWTITSYQGNLFPSSRSQSLGEGFDFLIGGDVKVKYLKLFFRGRADLFFKYPIEGVVDGTTIPLLTSSELGIIIPLSGQNKWK